ncbi:MAG: hypothetical protein PF961_04650, partial [Planctomycetota bacterium]|nr:hypothetical protein [Planctomycetota bacterium]
MFKRLLALSLFAGALCGAEIVLDDGQVINGTVIGKSGDKVMIEIDAGQGATAKVGMPAGRIIEVRDDSPEENQVAATALGGFAGRGGGYAEVKITGTVGGEITAKGIEQAIIAARRNGVRSLVFNVDSEGSGNLEEVRRIGRVLTKYRGSMDYHAYVKHCIGPALIFVHQAHHIHMAPDSRVGGPMIPADADEEELLMRSDIAHNATAQAREFGRDGRMIGAMIDPAITLAAWQAADRVQMAPALPSDVAKDKVIVVDGPDEVLVLTSAQLAKAGFKPVATVADIGAVIGRTDWDDSSKPV